MNYKYYALLAMNRGFAIQSDFKSIELFRNACKKDEDQILWAILMESETGEIADKYQPKKKRFGCHVDLEEGQEPDSCVIDSNERHLCIYANVSRKEQCPYWKEY